MKDRIKKLLDLDGELCLSLIAPAFRTSPERRTVPLILKHLKEEAIRVLSTNYGRHPNKDFIISNLNELLRKMDYNHLKNGVGLFVSKYIKEIVYFPFPVKGRVEVNERFLIRDLLYLKQRQKEFLVLSVGRKKLRVFEGNSDELSEIINSDFPFIYHEEYEYAKPVRGTSFGLNVGKGFEKDKSILKQIRTKDFYRSADPVVHGYLRPEQSLMLYGDQKEVSAYFDISRDKNKVVDKVFSRYGVKEVDLFKKKAKKRIQDIRRKSSRQLLDDIHEAPVQLLTSGLPEVWKHASEGNCRQLIVEKDFSRKAYLSADRRELRLTRPQTNNQYFLANDAVEHLLKLVKDLGGEIVFVENGNLSDFNRIVLLKRY